MSMTAVVLILVSAAIHVGWNLLTKSSGNPKVFSLLKGTLMSGIAVVALSALPLGEVPNGVWLLVLASGAIHFVYILALSTAYETGDISYVYPIARSAPALVPAAAFFFLGETVSMQGGAGIALVIVAVAFLQFRGRGGAAAGAVRSTVIRKDTLWAFVTLAAVVAYTLVDKAAMVRFARITAIPSRWHGPVFFMLQVVFCYLLFWLYLLATERPRIRETLRREWVRWVAAALGTMVSYSLILHVMKTEPVSYIVTLRQSSVLLAVLVGWVGLKEPYGGRRLGASAVMIVGFCLIASA